MPSKSVRRADAAAAAALIPGKPRKPRVLSDIVSFGKEESEEMLTLMYYNACCDSEEWNHFNAWRQLIHSLMSMRRDHETN